MKGRIFWAFCLCLSIGLEFFEGVNAVEGCPELRCFVPCPNGYALGVNNCATCDCVVAPPVADVAAGSSSLNQPDCPDLRCLIPCPNGYALGVNNCATCDCVVAPPSSAAQTGSSGSGASGDLDQVAGCGALPRCLVACDNGYKNDAQGCQTCTCNAVAGVKSAPVVTHNKPQGMPAWLLNLFRMFGGKK